MAPPESLLPSKVLDDLGMSTDDGISADLDVIFDAYENDAFWLPPCDVEVAIAVESPRFEPTRLENNQTFDASSKSGKTVSDLYPLQVAFQGRDISRSSMVPTQHFIDIRCQQVACDSPHISSWPTADCQLPSYSCVDSTPKIMLACPTDYGTVGGSCTMDATEPLLDIPCTTDIHAWTQDDIQHVLRCTLAESHENAMQKLQPPCQQTIPRRIRLPKAKSHQKGATATEPVSPLSAYNFFFRVERSRLLEDARCNKSMDPQSQLAESLSFYSRILAAGSSRDFQDLVLCDQWRRDSSVKRRHRKSHGHISFHSLAKQVSQSWRALPQQVKQVFREISARDFQRYDLEQLARQNRTTE